MKALPARLLPMTLLPALLWLPTGVAWAGLFQAAPWVCAMRDTVHVAHAPIRLGDIAAGTLPPEAAKLTVGQAPLPGGSLIIRQRGVLRRLVTAGLSRGVRFRGAANTVVIRDGAPLDRAQLRARAQRLLTALLPPDRPGAPAGSVELDLPPRLPAVVSAGEDLSLKPAHPLRPGRNHRALVLRSAGDGNRVEIPVTIHVHHYQEVAKARLKVARGQELHAGLFHWEWVDVGASRKVTDLFGREALRGSCSARSLRAGDYLRACDLKPIPVVRAGDRVELTLRRGAVMVSVPATARQEGSLGKVVPVRNELTKRLINARITGPGTVEWRN